MGVKKVPLRMCIGCRQMKPKRDLIRIVRSVDGEIKLDSTGKLNGRGAYICKNPECFKIASSSNALSRAFETNVSKEVYNRLAEELDNID